jgi:hypothetical protein
MARKLDEETEKLIKPIREKVAANQGEIVFVYRDFITDREEEGCFGGGTTFYSNHIQTGIITSPLSEKTEPEKFWHVQVLSGMSWDFPINFAVPAKRIVSAQCGGEVPRFQLRDQQLASASDGEIPFGFYDFYCQGEGSSFSLLGRLGMPVSYPKLKRFEVYVGDEEITRFAKQFGEGRVDLEKVREFVGLVKNEGEFSRRINEYQDGQAREIKNSLVRQVASLCLLEEGLIDIESLFERISRRGYQGTHEGLTEKYRELRSKVNRALSDVQESLPRSKDLDNEGQINGRIIGIPVTLDLRDYRSHVTNEVLPRVRGRLTKLGELLKV